KKRVLGEKNDGERRSSSEKRVSYEGEFVGVLETMEKSEEYDKDGVLGTMEMEKSEYDEDGDGEEFFWVSI
ncbi:hypothetical protein A2U01_0061404, partial [Trifolium medium]|nr:hypothetical protein [Trifolium medium]